MISIDRLTKRFGGTGPGAGAPVLDQLSLEVAAGAVVAVLGGSGAGKSTLLRCLVGLEPFQSGVVRVDGVELPGEEAGQGRRERRAALRAMRQRMGLVFQGLELFPHLTALENCALAPVEVKGLPRAAAEESARAHLRALGMEEKAAAYPDFLSGGQRQRVAIARALTMEPRVLLYDEPSSALDPSIKQELIQTLRRVREQGVTQILVTHDLVLARAADEVAVLAKGRVVERGPAEAVLQRPSAPETRALLAEESR